MRSPPVLLLDVDGVLNVQARGTEVEWMTQDVRGPDGRLYQLVTNPVHRIWLVELGAVYDLAWCTTWWRVANERLAPIWGLPALDAVPLPERFDIAATEYSPKTPHVRAWSNGRRIAWVDDEIDWSDADLLLAAGEGIPAADALTLPVDRSVGLSRYHVDELLAWA